jgi:hypothetical protein
MGEKGLCLRGTRSGGSVETFAGLGGKVSFYSNVRKFSERRGSRPRGEAMPEPGKAARTLIYAPPPGYHT